MHICNVYKDERTLSKMKNEEHHKQKQTTKTTFTVKIKKKF